MANIINSFVPTKSFYIKLSDGLKPGPTSGNVAEIYYLCTGFPTLNNDSD